MSFIENKYSAGQHRQLWEYINESIVDARINRKPDIPVPNYLSDTPDIGKRYKRIECNTFQDAVSKLGDTLLMCDNLSMHQLEFTDSTYTICTLTTPSHKLFVKINEYVSKDDLYTAQEKIRKANARKQREKKQSEHKQHIVKDVKPKLKTNVKFIVGEQYKLKHKSKSGSAQDDQIFVLKQKIYFIKDKEVNVVIMKQTAGPNSVKFCLNENDCKRYHIKYEPGLQVMSMQLNWIRINKK